MPKFNAAAQLTDLGIYSPATVIAERFLFQSYYDSTALERAILDQPMNDQIVPSTAGEQQSGGYAIGLHPSSQTPVAVQFRQGPGSAASAAVVLKPGQITRPSGGKFNGFRFGLPQGWLGGGNVQLVVFTSPEAHCDWGDHAEIIFHRSRFKIFQPADIGVALTAAPFNWPLSFPWVKAMRFDATLTAIAQGGKPVLAVMPTRSILVLRGITGGLVNPASVAAMFQGTDDFGLDSAGAPILTNPVTDYLTFPSYTLLGGAGNLSNQAQFIVQDGVWARLSADQGGVAFVDNTGAATLSGCFIDICRYGRL